MKYILKVKVETIDNLADIAEFEREVEMFNKANERWIQAEIIETKEEK